MSHPISFKNIMKLVLKSGSLQRISTDTQFSDLGINNEIIKGLATIGHTLPSEFQVVVLPQLMENDENVYLTTNSGAGKTMALIITSTIFSWLHQKRHYQPPSRFLLPVYLRLQLMRPMLSQQQRRLIFNIYY